MPPSPLLHATNSIHPPPFKPTYSPSRTLSSVPLVSIQSSSPAQCIDDCDPSIEEYNHHPRFLGHSLTEHNSLQPNEAPTHTVSTTSAGVRQFRSNSDTNQLPCAFHDQPLLCCCLILTTSLGLMSVLVFPLILRGLSADLMQVLYILLTQHCC